MAARAFGAGHGSECGGIPPSRRNQDYVDYFPSFEIFYTPGIGGAYFENDLRHIRIAGVNHAMRLFNSHYFDHLTSVNVDIRKYEIEKLSNNYNDVFCDEDLIK